MVDCLVMNFLSCRDGKLWNVSPSVYNKNESDTGYSWAWYR